jgi:hypothetical protein
MNTDTYALSELCDAMRAFILQRPGLEPANYYGAPGAYRADLRAIGQARNDALRMLDAFQLTARYGTPEAQAREARALAAELGEGGRLSARRAASGRVVLDYTAGQYWCTEYRRAACYALAGALWTLQREACPHLDGDGLRASFRHWFGPGIARRWFR